MLSERIKELRTARNISQVELARMLGVTKQSVSNWENDNIQPSIDMLIKISKVFSVPSDYLLSLDDRKFIEVTGLSPEIIEHIKLIISDITTNK
ncbi:MAG: helix-turn-helix transcriptional regulator [Clostridia bacterium]|nr:helix-turn-helix transcriptional regulator [Clostridia bacterium]